MFEILRDRGRKKKQERKERERERMRKWTNKNFPTEFPNLSNAKFILRNK